MRRVTIRDVAQRAGVSSSTVSRVLNDSASISQRTRQAVREACQAAEAGASARGYRAILCNTLYEPVN